MEINMASELGFEEKEFGEKAYECDPKKNINCRKTGCKFNTDLPMFARHCGYTLHKEYEWDGKSKRYDSYGCPDWLKGE